MTRLGEYLYSKSINQSELARKIGCKRDKVNNLCLHESIHLEAVVLYKIFLAIGLNPGEEFNKFFKDIKLDPNKGDDPGTKGDS